MRNLKKRDLTSFIGLAWSPVIAHRIVVAEEVDEGEQDGQKVDSVISVRGSEGLAEGGPETCND